jgi:hypothetical protein
MARTRAERAAWLARRLYRDPERPLPATATALEQGRVSVEHARVIATVTCA